MRALFCLLVLCSSVAPVAQAGRVAERAAQRFQQELPAARFYKTGSRITRVYGPSMGSGRTPRDAADAFIENHSEMFGVLPADLRFKRSIELMYGKFTAVQYDQLHEGVEVRLPDYSAGITILTRADVGNGIVLISADLYDLLGVRLDAPVINGDQAVASVATQSAGFAFTAPQLAVFAGTGEPTLAYRFVGERGDLASQEKYEFFVDAAKLDAPILHRESLIYHIDIEGNTSGWATQGLGSDQCAPDGFEAMPYTSVNIQSGNTAFADEAGDFVISHGGTDAVTVESPVRGRYFRVFNQAESDTVLQMDVTPPGPANFEHDAEQVEFKRAEVNAYIESNVIRDYTLRYNPDFPVIRDQTEFTVNVNIDSSCNAFYNGSSINFYRSGGSCPNTAYGTIVHHEYGHHLVNTAGSGQGQYGEGSGDVVGVLIMDDPRLALGFFGNCDTPLRTAENFREYPCSGSIHDCGQLLSGCVWDTRNELIVTEPDNYRDILGLLWFNSMPLHRGNLITPQITIDFLILDDDDDDIGNGTPHYEEIAAGFGPHNMAPPPLVLLSIRFPEGRPQMIAPTGGDRVRVEVEEVVGQAEPGSGKLHYSTGGDFIEIPMEEIEENVYDIVFPPVECGATLQYFVSVETTQGQRVTEPEDAPEAFFTTLAAVGTEVAIDDDFETDTGWTVVNENLDDGAWERGVPFGEGDAGPDADFDGSGQCYVTGNRLFQDIDGGPTRLISPTIDLTDADATVKYARWFRGGSSDLLVVEVSNDGGSSWVTVEEVSPDAEGWVEVEFRLGDFIAPSADVAVRFSASDDPNNSFTEAALDAFEVIALLCGGGDGCIREPEWQCDGDVDGDGQVNPVDSGLVQAAFGSTDEQDVCNYDVDCDGQINPVDSGIVQSLFGTCEAPRDFCP